MNEKDLAKEVECGLSTRQLAEKFECSQTNVRYYLKKYGMKTKKLAQGSERVCPMCKASKDASLFYNRRGKEGSSPYCKLCTNLQTVQRTRRLKSEAVQYKGGACEHCGYDRFDGALEFHHLDPNEKDFNISRRRSKGIDKIKDELDKCILLCSNCHREEHGRISGIWYAHQDSNLGPFA